MKVLISGPSGLVGSALCRSLAKDGHEVLRLVRRPATAPDEAGWNPEREFFNPEQIEGSDAVVHLAGENVAGARWTPEFKRKIHDSRYEVTRKLCENVALLDRLPEVLVSASAVGFYGDRGDEVLTETSIRGAGFMAEVCEDWEAAAEMTESVGMRLVILRLGMVLAREGGVLQRLVKPFRMGGGGRIGSGRQWWSWIHLDDVVGILRHVIENPAIEGVVNAVAPNPVTNADFTKALAKAVHRPAILPLPAFAAKLAFGEIAQELMLASTRVTPTILNECGYSFQHAELGSALTELLGLGPAQQ